MRNMIGQPAESLPTPALLVDADALEGNLRRMADFFAGRRCQLRPHFKSHKSVALARRQLAAGAAVGITAAKLSEAEVLVEGGVDDVLVANQVVGEDKAARLAALNRRATVRVAVDDVGNVSQLAQAARQAGTTVGALVEVDIGMSRCGAAPGERALAVARAVCEADGLRLDGLQGFEGHLVLVKDAAERRRRTVESMEILVGMRRLLEKEGLPCPIVSGGGTGTYDVTGDTEGVDEMQAGSYALMDAHYKKVRPEFDIALSVLATVVSARDGVAVADVGLKGLGSDFGFPLVEGFPQAEVMYVAEEHLPMRNVPAKVGDLVRLIPSHGCTTCNLHRRMWLVRGHLVEDVWDIEGSGCLE